MSSQCWSIGMHHSHPFTYFSAHHAPMHHSQDAYLCKEFVDFLQPVFVPLFQIGVPAVGLHQFEERRWTWHRKGMTTRAIVEGKDGEGHTALKSYSTLLWTWFCSGLAMPFPKFPKLLKSLSLSCMGENVEPLYIVCKWARRSWQIMYGSAVAWEWVRSLLACLESHSSCPKSWDAST